MPDTNLRNRASKNFDKYYQEFITTGKSAGLPAGRLTPDEWEQLNIELESSGIKLIKQQHNGNDYYWFVKIKSNLRNRASKNFQKYFDTFIQTGESAGLPASRLTPDEWEQLNTELESQNIKLVKREKNGIMYYWFTHLPNKTKSEAYNQGRHEVVNMLFDRIKEKYPNISNVAILEIIETKGLDPDLIYNKLRFKQDADYADVSEKQYHDACEYAIQCCDNLSELVLNPSTNNWNPREYRTNVTGQLKSGTALGRHIHMRGTQNWTWFRSCSGNILPPVNGDRHVVGFHMSLNVNVYNKTLQTLDEILIQDGRRYIDSYKFAKEDHYYSDVLKRHDSITIYMYARNPELEQQIVQAMKPFVRSNEGLLDEILGPGVSISVETSNNDGPSVGQQAANDISKMIREYSSVL